ATARGGVGRAGALHWCGGGARCVRSHIPGALSILKGAVPGRARGLGHMAPTYFRREPGIVAPTAIAAPRCFPAIGTIRYGATCDGASLRRAQKYAVVLAARASTVAAR